MYLKDPYNKAGFMNSLITWLMVLLLSNLLKFVSKFSLFSTTVFHVCLQKFVELFNNSLFLVKRKRASATVSLVSTRWEDSVESVQPGLESWSLCGAPWSPGPVAETLSSTSSPFPDQICSNLLLLLMNYLKYIVHLLSNSLFEV